MTFAMRLAGFTFCLIARRGLSMQVSIARVRSADAHSAAAGRTCRPSGVPPAPRFDNGNVSQAVFDEVRRRREAGDTGPDNDDLHGDGVAEAARASVVGGRSYRRSLTAPARGTCREQ